MNGVSFNRRFETRGRAMRTVARSVLSILVATPPPGAAGADQKGGGVRADVLAAVEGELARLAKQAEREAGPVHPRPSSEVAFLLLTGLAAQGTRVEPAAEAARQLGIVPSNKVEMQVFAV